MDGRKPERRRDKKRGNPGAETEFFWNRTRRTAYEQLSFAVASQSSLTLAIGPAGCGKTRLLREVAKNSNLLETVGVVWDPAAFERDPGPPLTQAFSEAIVKNNPQHGERPARVLIVDGAERLSRPVLEAVCGLAEPPDLRLILVGRPPLLDVARSFSPETMGPYLSIPLFDQEEAGEYAARLLGAVLEETGLAIDDARARAIFARSDGRPAAIREICEICGSELAEGKHSVLEPDYIRKLPLSGVAPAVPDIEIGTVEQVKRPAATESSGPAGENDQGALLRSRGRGPDDGRILTSEIAISPPEATEQKTGTATGAVRSRRHLGLGFVVLSAAAAVGAAVFLVMEPARLGVALGDLLVTGRSVQIEDDGTGDLSDLVVDGALERYQRNVAFVMDIPDNQEALLEAGIRLATERPEEAHIALVRAALSGNARASYFLGQVYEAGEGVPVDLARARAWYSAAAELGIDRAAQRLEGLPEVDRTGAPGAPLPLYSGPTGASFDFVWVSGPGRSPAEFQVEFRGSDGALEAVTSMEGRSAARLAPPIDAIHWRVTATWEDEAGAVSSLWYPIMRAAPEN